MIPGSMDTHHISSKKLYGFFFKPKLKFSNHFLGNDKSSTATAIPISTEMDRNFHQPRRIDMAFLVDRAQDEQWCWLTGISRLQDLEPLGNVIVLNEDLAKKLLHGTAGKISINICINRQMNKQINKQKKGKTKQVNKKVNQQINKK